MGKALDLTGQKFGRLTVVRLAKKGRARRRRWLCRCQCGRDATVQTCNLQSGNTSSCGCLQRERTGRSNSIDLTGKRFGYLKAIIQTKGRASGSIVWLCACDCGNEAFVSARHLGSGHTTSCGCKARFPVNDNFFKVWTPEMAWLVGFFAADGCVYKGDVGQARISFTQKNGIGIIIAIRDLLGLTQNIYRSKNNRETCTVSFSSDSIHEDLCSIFGVDSMCAKSLTLPFPSYIKKEYARDFVRGCIDGDGTINGSKPFVSLCSGSESFVDGMMDFVKEEAGIVGVKYSDRHGTFYVTWRSIKGICLAEWLYRDCAISLQSKKDRAQDAIKKKTKYIKQQSLTPKMCHMFPGLIPEKYRERCLREAGM